MTKTDLTVADYLTKAIELSGRTQREIALDVGYYKPNVISMMKQGQTKIPLDKIPAFAKALEMDAAFFLRLALAEYHPDTWAVIRATIGSPLTSNERDLIDLYQHAAPNDEIAITTQRSIAILEALGVGAERDKKSSMEDGAAGHE